MHKGNIVNQLVITSLEEGRIDGHYRAHSLAGQPACKGNRMLFRHSHIKESLREPAIEILQPGAVLHSCRNGTNSGV